MVGSRLGRPLLRIAPERVLRGAFVLYLGLAAVRSIAGSAVPSDVDVSPSAPITIVVGAAAGLSSVLLGVGGGVVTVPALAVLGGGMSFHTARATSLVMSAVSAAVGSRQHRALGTTDAALAGRLVPGVAVGAVLGVVLANLLPAAPCQLIFGAFLVVAAVRMAWRRPSRSQPNAPDTVVHTPAAVAARRAVALVAFVSALLLCFFSTPASAQQAGDSVEVAVPAGTAITTGSEGDKILFVGRPMAVTDAQDCAADGLLRVLQPVVMVDAGSGSRATRSEGVVTISINGSPATEGLKNGTRIGNLTGPDECTIHGAPYHRYNGIIE